MEVDARLRLEDPNYAARMEAIEAFTQSTLPMKPEAPVPVVTIPTVVHVVYNTASENISDAQVLSQLEVLNEDFPQAECRCLFHTGRNL